MKKSIATIAILLTTFTYAKDTKFGGVVNFTKCISDSKVGKDEQQNLEKLRNQMVSNLEEMEKELKDLSEKLKDEDYVDCLSAKAEEELKLKYNNLNEDLARYKNQFNQVLQYNQYQIMQKINSGIEKAAEKVAKEKQLPFVISKDACYYYNPDYEVTSHVIGELDKQYEIEKKEQKNLSQKEEKKDAKKEVTQKENSTKQPTEKSKQ